MPGMPWCRLYSEVVDDDKLTYLADCTGERRVVIMGVWTGLLALANRSPERGVLLLAEGIPYTISMLARKLDIEEDTLDKILNGMCALGLLEGTPLQIAAFHKRNFSSDNSTERSRQWRERQKEEDETVEDTEDETMVQRCNDDDATTIATIPSVSGSGSVFLRGEGECEGEGGRGPPSKPPLRQPTETQQRFSAIAAVCRMDADANRGRLNRAEKALRGYPPAIILHRYGPHGWWYVHDWRGQKKQPPTPEQICETIEQATGDLPDDKPIDFDEYEREFGDLFGGKP